MKEAKDVNNLHELIKDYQHFLCIRDFLAGKISAKEMAYDPCWEMATPLGNRIKELI